MTHCTHSLRSPAAVLSLAFLLAAPLAAQDKIDFRVAPEKGSKIWFRLTTLQETAIDMMGQPMNLQNELTYDCELEFTAVSKDGGADFEVRCIAVRGTMELPMLGLMEFDSNSADDGDDNPMLAGVRSSVIAIAGKCVRGKVDAKGRVTELPGLAEGLARMSGGGRGGMAAGMTAQFTDAGSIERQIGELFVLLPKDALAVGEEFSIREKDSMGGGASMLRNGSTKFEKLDGDTAVLVSKGTITSAAAAKDAGEAEEQDPMAAMRRGLKVEKGSFSSETRVDRKTGMKQGSKSKLTMEMSMPSPMGGEERASMRITSSSTVDRLTARPAGKAAKTKPGADGGKDK